MTKADLVDKIAAKAGITKIASEKTVNAFLDSVHEALLDEGKLSITGFGTFAVEERQERKWRNPRTGEPITIPPAKVVKFRPGKNLKDSLN